jgi:hypothetical protein
LLLTLLVMPVAYSMFEDWAKLVNVVGAQRIGSLIIAAAALGICPAEAGGINESHSHQTKTAVVLDFTLPVAGRRRRAC